MAQAGERAVAIPAGADGFVLDGIYVAGAEPDSGGAVVAPPHPLYGGSMDSPVVDEMAWACSRSGFASLRFNWRGVGASSGATSGELADADADYGAALEHLAETVTGPLVACGYSFGAAAALRAAAREPRVRRVVLVAPPAPMLDAAALEALRGGALAVVGDSDAIASASELEALLTPIERARLVVVSGADHFFGVGLADVGAAVSEWL